MTASTHLARKKRHKKIRGKIKGTQQRPRLFVFRSARHIYAQAINDETGHVIASASTLNKEITEQITGYAGNVESSKIVGQSIAKKLLDESISSVVFDRGGFLYHGRVKALADSAREAGLNF